MSERKGIGSRSNEIKAKQIYKRRTFRGPAGGGKQGPAPCSTAPGQGGGGERQGRSENGDLFFLGLGVFYTGRAQNVRCAAFILSRVCGSFS
jgi:hypothetical protein